MKLNDFLESCGLNTKYEPLEYGKADFADVDLLLRHAENYLGITPATVTETGSVASENTVIVGEPK